MPRDGHFICVGTFEVRHVQVANCVASEVECQEARASGAIFPLVALHLPRSCNEFYVRTTPERPTDAGSFSMKGLLSVSQDPYRMK